MPTVRHDLRFRAAGWLSTRLLRACHATWHVRLVDQTGCLDAVGGNGGPVMVAFWHRHILSMLTHFAGHRIVVPVSLSEDGEYVAHAMEHMGFASVRGSTSRGSLALLKGLLEKVAEGYSVAATPDGPRGPLFSVQPGLALLAERTGLPLHPIGLHVRGAWMANSWDRFVVPLPFARIGIVIAPALHRGDYVDRRAFCQMLRARLFAATEGARCLCGLHQPSEDGRTASA